DANGLASPASLASVGVDPISTAEVRLPLAGGLSLVGVPANPAGIGNYMLSQLSAQAGGAPIVRLDPGTGRFVLYSPSLTPDMPVAPNQGYLLLRGGRQPSLLQTATARRWSADNLTRHLV